STNCLVLNWPRKRRRLKSSTISHFSDLFCDEAQIDPTFLQLILFFFDEPTNLDGLINDLATLASTDETRNKNETRLFDLLFVTCRSAELREEQKIRGAPYDLYYAEVKGRLACCCRCWWEL
ncbi:hypothetical protein PENTCL1PPCAC_1529, partial [Pristionchus entomophagus]